MSIGKAMMSMIFLHSFLSLFLNLRVLPIVFLLPFLVLGGCRLVRCMLFVCRKNFLLYVFDLNLLNYD